MSTEKIYGGWDTQRFADSAEQQMQWLWHRLAAQCVGSDRQQNNSGLSQRKNEIIELWHLFRRQQPRVVVEIGTSQGGTLAAWCLLAPEDALIVSIDRCVDDCRPRPGDPVHTDISNRSEKYTSQGGGAYYLKQPNQTLVAINGWSYEKAVMDKLLATLNGRKIDFLMHDASHASAMFAADWKLYWPLVAPDGVFASHDINWSADPLCDKRTEWQRIKREEAYSACYEYLPHPSISEMGIGVLVK